jgi:methylated-DNA-[protein]-cysteine S-methyltransferase
MSLSQRKIPSPVGELYLVASDKGLRGIYKKKQAVPVEPSKVLDSASRELNEYFSGDRKKFSVPLDLEGTDFQKKVWAELIKIPYGTTVSYREIATRIRSPKAVRAVGSANGKNPLCIVVPCHRVIAADGGLGGYSGGLKMKSKLLELEGLESEEQAS